MEIPGVVDERERERERVNSSPSFPRRHKILFGFIVTIGIIVYAAFNIWVYQYSSGNAPSPKALWQKVTKSGTGFEVLKGESLPTPPAKSREAGSGSAGQDLAPPDTPTPRPTGAGSYACSPEGTCNVYNDETRKQYCTMTYADNRCLDQCGTKENQCKK